MSYYTHVKSQSEAFTGYYGIVESGQASRWTFARLTGSAVKHMATLDEKVRSCAWAVFKDGLQGIFLGKSMLYANHIKHVQFATICEEYAHHMDKHQPGCKADEGFASDFATLRALLNVDTTQPQYYHRQYRQFVQTLGEVLPKYEDGSHTEFFQGLLEVRYAGIDMYDTLAKMVDMFIPQVEASPPRGRSPVPRGDASLTVDLMESNASCDMGSEKVGPSKWSVLKQRFKGNFSLPHYNAGKNAPWIDERIGPCVLVRMGCPTMGRRKDHAISTDFKWFLRHRKGPKLLTTFQDYIPGGIETKRVQSVLDLEKVEGLDTHVLLQPMQGPLFQQKGKYKNYTLRELKDELLKRVRLSPTASAADYAKEPAMSFPEKLRLADDTQVNVEKLMKGVHERYFGRLQDTNTLTKEQWIAFMNIFYAKSDEYVRTKLGATYGAKFCKDGVDRTGGMMIVRTALEAEQAGKDVDVEPLKVKALGPALFVRGGPILRHHMEESVTLTLRHLESTRPTL